MFLMPISGVLCFGFLLTLYHSLTGASDFFYTNHFITEFLAAAATGYVFYFAVRESFAVKKQLNNLRSRPPES